MNIAAWNVRILQDQKHLERKTTLIVRFMRSNNVCIAALSETRLLDSERSRWRRESGMGFAISNDIVHKLESLPNGINDCLMLLRISIDLDKYATLVSEYAPTLGSTDAVKDRFYSDLSKLLNRIPNQDKTLLLGDFTACLGSDYFSWSNILSKMNSNGLLLQSLCREFRLFVTNTLFQQTNKNKIAWYHPRSSGHGHLIDYVIVRSQDRNYIELIRSFHKAEYWSDYAMVCRKIEMKLKPAIKQNCKKRRLDISKLKVKNKDILAQTLDEKLHNVRITENKRIKVSTIHESFWEVLGFYAVKTKIG
uniref:Endonuclease/exonuclease/phosphatase domain-containing protein n=1 Tax=Octopus bimaculoides TaxID=37653 RepID=A0A0L8FNN0_OCTBM